jgi:hypothetical protein
MERLVTEVRDIDRFHRFWILNWHSFWDGGSIVDPSN